MKLFTVNLLVLTMYKDTEKTEKEGFIPHLHIYLINKSKKLIKKTSRLIITPIFASLLPGCLPFCLCYNTTPLPSLAILENI